MLLDRVRDSPTVPIDPRGRPPGPGSGTEPPASGGRSLGLRSPVVRFLVDVVMLLLAVGLSSWSAQEAGMELEPRWALFVFPPLALVILQLRGLYVSRIRVEALDLVIPTVSAISIAAMLTLVAGDVLDSGHHPVMLRLWTAAAALVAFGRILTSTAERRLRQRGVEAEPTLVVGAGAIGNRLAARLLEHPEYGLRPVGFVDDDPIVPNVASDLPVLGGLDRLGPIIDGTGARQVMIAFAGQRDREMARAARVAQGRGARVSVVPRLFDAVSERAVVEHVGGLPVMRLTAGPRSSRLRLKHAFDRTVAVGAIVLLSPVLAGLCLAVRLSSPGPVIFRQRRIGRDGQEFDLLKFRSMRPPPSETPGFLVVPGSAPGGVEGEDRRTAVGRFLRRASLDELPQLVNIARGEMSLVGPRPERPEFVQMFSRDIERYGDRHRMRAGLTGWAQIHNLRGQTSLEKRVEWDNYYIENWSPWLDIKILSRTALAVVRGGDGVS